MRRFVLALILSTLTVLAQSDRGTITGRVIDPSQAAVSGASITITNQETGIRTAVKTSETGNYVVQQLPVGRYEITIEAQGFRKVVRRDTDLNVAQTLTLNVTLEVGQVEQTVEVTAAAPLLESSTSDLGTAVDRNRVVELPLAVAGNMRHPGAFVFLAPGVTGDTGNTQINGSQSRAKEILMDGIGSTSPESGGLLFTYPPVESISEFKLLASNFSAEFGRTGAGFEIYTTRSGGNQFHGSLWEYLRNDKLDARGFIAAKRAINRQNEFGAALGGPALLPGYNGRNRTFFHFVYNGFRYRAGALNELATLPTAAMRQGDFARVLRGSGLTTIYDPASTRPDSGGFTRTAFAGNQIPASRFSTVAKNILPLIPAPSNANQSSNFQVAGAASFGRNAYTAKLDHQFSERNRVNAFFFINGQDSVAAERFPGALSPALAESRPSRWIRLNHDFIFSPTTLNNFRAGYTREPQKWARVASGKGYLQTSGFKGVNPPGDILPRISFSDGLSNWGDETKNTGQQTNNALQLADTLSHIRGNHSFKFGADVRWMQTNGADPFNQQSALTFNSNETAMPTAAGRPVSGHSFASFLLGQVDQANYNGLFVVPGNRYRYFATFFQDDWKLTRRLTLNYGLRYEIYFPRIEAHGNFSGFDPNLPNPNAGGRPGAVAFLGQGDGRDNSRQSFADTDYKSFGPRIGFAYQVREKLVVRGGYGIFYGAGNATSGLRSSQQYLYGFNAAPSWATPDAGVTPAFQWDGGLPTNWPRPPFINPTVQNGSNVNYIGKGDGRPPYFQNFQLSVQREYAGRVMVEASYVGVKGTRLGNNLVAWNQVDPAYLKLGAALTQNINSPAVAPLGIAKPWPTFNGTVAQALRAYPQFLNVNNNANPNGNSTYHALQIKADKRFSRGFALLGSYTWAKTLADGDIAAGGGPGGQDHFNRRLEKSLSTNDVPQVFALSGTYELPIARSSKYFGGWQLTGIAQYQAGRPVTLTASNTLPIFNNALRPDVAAGAAMTATVNNPLADVWINKAAFAAPTGFRFGTAARAYAQLRAPGYLNESFGVIKRTQIYERLTLTFRAEFFNLFNRTVFGAPVGNVSAANFGRVNSQTNNPRQGQMALRLDF